MVLNCTLSNFVFHLFTTIVEPDQTFNSFYNLHLYQTPKNPLLAFNKYHALSEISPDDASFLCHLSLSETMCVSEGEIVSISYLLFFFHYKTYIFMIKKNTQQ